MPIHSETVQDVFSAIEQFREGGKTVVFLHGCNAQGRMGAGVAKEVASRYPAAYSQYRSACLVSVDDRDLVGTTIPVWVDPELLVVNAVTQQFYGKRGGAKPEWIASCLKTVSEEVSTSSDTVFVTVPVGCGLGGLDWADVHPLFENSPLPWRIYRV